MNFQAVVDRYNYQHEGNCQEMHYAGEVSPTNLINNLPTFPSGVREYASANITKGKYVVNPYSSEPLLADLRNSRIWFIKVGKDGILANGDGVLRTGSGLVLYKGFFLSGYKHGFGTSNIFTFHAGETGSCALAGEYNGEWKFGFRDGFGEFKQTDGTTYEGQWKYDTKSGFGSETSLDGSKFIGMWYLDHVSFEKKNNETAKNAHLPRFDNFSDRDMVWEDIPGLLVW